MQILVAEDNFPFRCLLDDTLREWGYDVILAINGVEAWEILRGPNPPQLAILDWVMPGMDGPQVCREVRRRNQGPYTYLLLLTARSGKEDVVGGLDAGADDYLVKPIDVNELRARLRAGRRILDLQEQLLAAHAAMRHEATHDPLTGLWNRSAVLGALNRELVRGQRERKPLGVMMLDIDHFKQINDRFGHLAGDGVLREVCHRLGHAMRPYDTVGRYGGEEFLVVLPDCDAVRAFHLGERLRQRIAERPFDLPEGLVPVTISVGVATADPVEHLAADPLLRAADAALYRAKRSGRNRVEMAPGGPPENAGGKDSSVRYHGGHKPRSRTAATGS